jgi:hypothetical protein
MLLSHEQQLGELQKAVKNMAVESQIDPIFSAGAAGGALESRVQTLELAREIDGECSLLSRRER